MTNGVLQRIGDWTRTLLKSEKLDELPESRAAGNRKSFVGWLVQADELPIDEPPTSGAGRSFRSRLFGTEALPLDDPPKRNDRASLLETLFSRERLGTEPAPGRWPGSRGRPNRGGGKN